MRVNQQSFGKIEDKEIILYELISDNVRVKIMNYGATITSLLLKNHKNEWQEIACGFDTLDEYLSDQYLSRYPYFGVTIGRYASRIKRSEFAVDNTKYNISKNEGDNHLHGGTKGFDKKIWSPSITIHKNSISLCMQITSPHLDEGYPGKVDIKVNFELNTKNEFSINYYASTDRATPISLTNHTYFNLSGFSESIHNHKTTILSDYLLEMDEEGIAGDEKISLNNSIKDFRTKKPLQEVLTSTSQGLDDYYVFDTSFKLVKVASFSHIPSKIAMDIYTTEPGMLFYTGYHISDKLKRDENTKYGSYCGFCCETHRYPNGPNLQKSPKSITYPNDPYLSQTKLKFKLR